MARTEEELYLHAALVHFNREILEGRREDFPCKSEIRDYAEFLHFDLDGIDISDRNDSEPF